MEGQLLPALTLTAAISQSTLVCANSNKGGGGGRNPSYHIWALLLTTHLASWSFLHLL